MPLTSAYWPVPFTSVAQSVFMVVLLLCSMETAFLNMKAPLTARIHRCPLVCTPLKPADANPSEHDGIEHAREKGPPGVPAPRRGLHRAREQRRHRPAR